MQAAEIRDATLETIDNLDTEWSDWNTEYYENLENTDWNAVKRNDWFADLINDPCA